MDFFERFRGRRIRRAAAVAAGLLLLWAVVGFLVLPPVLRPIVERKIGEALHRKAMLRGLSINPFALSVTLTGLDVRDRDDAPFFSFERLYLNAEATSVFRGGPVLRAITLTRPSLSLVRNADGTYSVRDLIEEFSKAKPEDKKPLRFSLNNIRLEGGRVDFDDRPRKTRHEVRELRIGIPFLSNIPSKVEITTQPVFEAKVNGSPFALHGKTKPFSETHETTLDLDLTDVDVPYYLAYIPADIPSKLTSGRLDAKLVFIFSRPPKGKPALVVSGTAALRKLAVELDEKPLVAWERFEAVLDSVDVFGRKARIRSLKLVAPEFWVRRETMGEHNIARALVAPAARQPGKTPEPAPPGPESPPFAAEVAEMALDAGKIHYDNFAFHPAFHALLSDVAVSMKGFSTAPGRRAALEASARSDAGETFRNAGTVSMEPLVVEGTLSAEGVPLKRYTTFLDEFIPVAIDDGFLALKTGYTFTTGKNANTTLTDLAISMKSPRVRKKAEKEPFFRAAAVELTGSSVDLAKHTVVLGSLESGGGYLAVVREKDGNADLLKLVPERPAGAPPPPPSAPWDVLLKRVSLSGYTVRMDDRSMARPARYALTKTDLVLENFSSAEGWKGSLTTRFGLDGRGAASAKGRVGFKPMYADLRVDVKGVDLVPIEAYVLQDLRLDLARAIVSAGGTLAIHEDATGKASVVYAGDAVVANVLATDPSTQLDFVGWEAFSATGMKAGYNPIFLEAKQVAIVGLACNLTIESDGTLNVRKVMGRPEPMAEGEDAADPASAPAATPAAAAEGVEGAKGPSAVMPVRIDELTLQGGRIGLADHFVKPSYSATLGDLGGRVTGLSSA